MNDAVQYLQMSDEAIYELLGEAAITHQGLAGTDSWKDKLTLGKSVFEEYKAALRSYICGNKKLLNALKSEEVNTSINVLGLLIPLITPLVLPGSAVLVAALLVKYGVVKYCDLP